MQGESVFDDDELLIDRPVKASRIELPKHKPDITQLYTEKAREWHRLQAIADLLPRLQKGLEIVTEWEKRYLAGEIVQVNTSDLMKLTGGTGITVRKQFARFRNQHHRMKVWLWQDVRTFAISRFTRSVFHEYLSALE